MSRTAFSLAILLLAAAGRLFSQDAAPSVSPGNPAGAGRDTPSPHTLKTIAPGDWGQLEYYPLILEPPKDYLKSSPSWDPEVTGTVWHFYGQGADQVRQSLIETGLETETVDRLMAKAVNDPVAGRLAIEAPEDVILSLDPIGREKLYRKIGPPEGPNPFSKPFGIDPRGFETMAAGSRLPSNLIELVSALTYTRAGIKLFSDIALVSARMPDEAGRLVLFGTLLRQPSSVVRLRLGPDSDLSAIAEYWSAGGRNARIRPLLESMANQGAVETIDMLHLLPPTPRKLLNTFPSPMMSIGESFPDCFWTAMNFFNDEPSDRYLDNQWLGEWLDEDYETVQRPLRLGDVIMFANADNGKPIHACNYLAGDLIFTKNGLSLMKPWTVQTIDDVLGTYLTEERVSVSFFRKRL